jgi:hypothetical protein
VTANSESWLQPHLETVLRNRTEVLASWRQQVPTGAGRPKNFEGWLVVELVHQILMAGFTGRLRTAGHFGPEKIKAIEVKNLHGSKAKGTHLSPDISILLADERTISAEIKTGFAPRAILDDLQIVWHYKEKHIADQAEFGWVAVIPEEEKVPGSCKKTCDNIYRAMAAEKGFLLKRTDVTEWLFFCGAIPIGNH